MPAQSGTKIGESIRVPFPLVGFWYARSDEVNVNFVVHKVDVIVGEVCVKHLHGLGGRRHILSQHRLDLSKPELIARRQEMLSGLAVLCVEETAEALFYSVQVRDTYRGYTYVHNDKRDLNKV